MIAYLTFRSAGLDPVEYAEIYNARRDGSLMGHLGMHWLEIEQGRCLGEMPLQPWHFAGNGYVHAGSVVAFADSACGHGCTASRPEGSLGFTTIELKSNFLGTAVGGTLGVEARLAHGGRTTQVWDAEVFADDAERRTIALFRCTQLVFWPKPDTKRHEG